ncbi:gfo/Idh/MocA family oxidoreductase [Shewanella baltica]|uniref:gfo/Idh/MocA family oxidoreductase n=1 Tax=Shewanella baltica TaxID=62322 RepID=UPI003D081CD0
MIWLIGSGSMSVEYVKVLEAQEQEFLVIGRGKFSSEEFHFKTGKSVVEGGLNSFLATMPEIAEAAIVSVGVAQLYETTLELIKFGVKKILVEKPGAMTKDEICFLEEFRDKHSCEVYIAYNRRFYSSVIYAKNRIISEGGVTSFNFELTEWAHVIENTNKPESVLNKWFLANSTHVADLAFYLGGKPAELVSFVQGSLKWHPAASVFAGAGITDRGALFNYAANWESAGRWSVEVLTKENRYIFRPIEGLQVQQRGTIHCSDIQLEDHLDKDFKPGLFIQVEKFLSENCEDKELLCKLNEQVEFFSFYERMAGYDL